MQCFKDDLVCLPSYVSETKKILLGDCDVLAHVRRHYYVLALPEVTGYVCALRKGFCFCLNKRPFKILIDRVSWDTRACAREPIHHSDIVIQLSPAFIVKMDV